MNYWEIFFSLQHVATFIFNKYGGGSIIFLNINITLELNLFYLIFRVMINIPLYQSYCSERFHHDIYYYVASK